MRIGVIRPEAPERRVALTPAVTGRIADKHEIMVEAGAGTLAGFPDAAFVEAGARLCDDAYDSDLVLVTGLTDAAAARVRERGAVMGLLEPLDHPDRIAQLAVRGVTAISFELLPRTTRAQSMDVLSSQATVVGYQAVLEAAVRLPKFFPMLTTAAGTIRPATVIVLGVGVAGLQAIATARRLGAVVLAYDVRAAAAEQVKSLGARFIELDLEQQDASHSGGYAQALAADDQARLLSALEAHVVNADAVITTAAIPGRTAPLLVTESMVAGLAPGSVIVDGAASTGGNCALTVAGEIVEHRGVTIVGLTDLASRTATHASEMYGRNVYELLNLLAPDAELVLDFSDEIVDGVVVAHGGTVRAEPVARAGGPSASNDAEPSA